MNRITPILTILALAAMTLAVAASPQTAAPVDRGSLRASIRQHLADRNFDAIVAHGPGVMPVLLELHNQADTRGRVEIANAFYRLGLRSEEAKELLMADARSLNEDLRISAQYALGRVSDDPAIVDLLVENLQTGFNPLVRDKAACSLAYDQIHLGDRQKVRLFRKMIELLESPSPETRWLAINVLRVHTGQLKGYSPQGPEERRVAAVERWKRWIEEYDANL